MFAKRALERLQASQVLGPRKNTQKHVKTAKTKKPPAQKHTKTRVFWLKATLASKAFESTPKCKNTQKHVCFRFVDFCRLFGPFEKHTKTQQIRHIYHKHTLTHKNTCFLLFSIFGHPRAAPGSPSDPKATKETPEVPQRDPKGTPKGCQRDPQRPKGGPRAPQGDPKGTQRDSEGHKGTPKVPKGTPKGPQKNRKSEKARESPIRPEKTQENSRKP